MARLDLVSSELLTLQAELDATRREATLGTLLGMIAHEFRNLMTPIRSYSQLALRSPDDEALRTKALHHAMNGADRANRIADAILALAGAEPLLPEADLPLSPVAPIIEAACECLSEMRPGGTYTVARTLAPELTAAIDAAALQQIVLNLLSNAVDALPDGRGALAVRTFEGPTAWPEAPQDPTSSQNPSTPHRSSTWNMVAGQPPAEPGHVAIIEVADDGLGMSGEFVERIFDPYVSHRPGLQPAGSTALRRRQPGVGLGLTVCRTLVDAAGGRIGVQTKPGEGTTFRVELPLGDTNSTQS